MSDFLSNMAKRSGERAAVVKRTFKSSDLDRPAYPLRLTGFDLIAELKNRSPAEGELNTNAGNRIERAQRYVEGGATAISVLTEPAHFDGALAHLDEVVDAVSVDEIPVMRKDFLVASCQILQAKAAGASGVLLIAAMLDDDILMSLLDCAFEHDLFVLLESFEELDLERSVHILQRVKYRQQAARQKFLIGINTRDLRSLAVDPIRLKKFGPLLPQGVTSVAESGQRTAEDAAGASAFGYDMTLVGTALMRAQDPTALIGDMLTAGRKK